MLARPALCRLTAVAVAAVLVTGLPTADAQAPAGHYTVSAETALDTRTALVWQRSPVALYDLGFGTALQECQKLNLGGYASGWRLPNIRELLSIVDEREARGPMWDRTVFTGGPLSTYWSSTDVAASPTEAWVFTFTPGLFMETRAKANSGALVRCVH